MTISEIKVIKVIKEFKHEGLTFGVYLVTLQGEEKILVRNGDSVGIIAHYIAKQANECISLIRDDIKQEFLKALEGGGAE